MKKLVFYCVIFLLFVTGCNRNRWKVDLKGSEVKLEIGRLDQDLFSMADKGEPDMQSVRAKYGDFFEIYNTEIIAIGPSSDSLYSTYLRSFVSDSVVAEARAAVVSEYKSLSGLEKEFSRAFSYFHHHFPSNRVPRLYSYVSGYNQTIVTTPDVAAFSLDNYLGPGYRPYQLLGINEYKRRLKYPEKIPYDVMTGWLTAHFEEESIHEDLLSGMIYQGKILTMLDACFPESHDSLKIGFSRKQLEWCAANEASMWTFLIEHRKLFSNDRMEKVRFLQSAPFTSAFSKESPGRTGAWLGWQIVRRYMEKNPSVTLQELMNEKDAHKLLNLSGYAP